MDTITLAHNGQLPQNPIFIVGYPRSGTTLLQGLLVTQPGFCSFPETHYFSVVERSIQTDAQGNIVPSCLDKVLEKIAEKAAFRFPPEDVNDLSRLAENRQLTSKTLFEYLVTHLLFQRYGKALFPAPGRGLGIAGFQPALFASKDAGDPMFRWIEKTPTHANFLPRMVALYPQCQIVHILRHPVPAIYSRKRNFPYNKETPVARLAQQWNRLQQNVEKFKAGFPGYVYTLKYEELISDLPKALGLVGQFLHVAFDFSLTSNFQHNISDVILPGEPWKTADGQKPFANTNAQYKDLITQDEAEAVESIVTNTMTKYGYTPYFQK